MSREQALKAANLIADAMLKIRGMEIRGIE
jgi:hypothetical protein